MERWPPAYDAEDLLSLIHSIKSDHRSSSFFDLRPTVAQRCQGDIVHLPSGIPVLDSNGDPGVTDHESELWLVVGNTCDFERDLDDLQWTQIVPLLSVGTEADIEPGLLLDFKNYRVSRYFYVPDWRSGQRQEHFLAELPMPVTVDKSAILSAAVHARLSRSAWILLNACLVRFLARDDGRFAA